MVKCPTIARGWGGGGVVIGALVFSYNLLYCVLIIETIIIIVEKFNYTLLMSLLLTIKKLITNY